MEPKERKEQIKNLLDQDLVFHAQTGIDSLIKEMGYRKKCNMCHQLVRIAFDVNVKLIGSGESKERCICDDCLSKMGFIITDLSHNVVKQDQ